jgi:hypothetical protein
MKYAPIGIGPRWRSLSHSGIGVIVNLASWCSRCTPLIVFALAALLPVAPLARINLRGSAGGETAIIAFTTTSRTRPCRWRWSG